MAGKTRKKWECRGEIVEALCDWISQGKTLMEFCRQEGRPQWRVVYNWIEKDPDFAARYAKAREIGEDAIAQECFDIADNASNDWMERQGKNGQTYMEFDKEHVQRSKLRIYTRLQLLAKWNPKKYGERTTLAGDKDAPLHVEQTTTFADVPLATLIEAAGGGKKAGKK